ncbi:P-type conjugative transfer protein TrbL [Pannonibacter phragmitetus]|jgi:type IV secretion system protein TrbL|uniref:P-type conjugative transfer protein TrbL n=1 Tax=Pannonibacter phragmitetus TaxID=121719 RepID=UPI000F03D461|nr:P-type conjugative transfer protein TrbL [Pannonibacter phragmitetus]
MRSAALQKLPAVVLVLLVLNDPVLAQDGTVLTEMENQVVAATQGWQDRIIQAATSLFWILAGIEVGVAAVMLAIQAPALEAWFGELVRRILFIGFFLFVLQVGPDFARSVVDSLFQIGAEGGSASPANVFNAGVRVASELSENVRFGIFEDNAMAMAAVFAMIVVVICFALVAAIFVSVLVEMYVGLLAGMIMLGLGGSSFTKDFAVRYLVYAFSVGMKLMALVMIARIGSEVLIGMSNNASSEDQFLTTLTIAGISVVVFMIALYVPGIIQGVVQGVSVSSGMETFRAGAQIASFAAVGAGAAIGAAGVAKGGMAAASAARASGAGIGGQASAAMKAMGGAVGGAATDKLMGIPGARMGSTLGLANQKLRDSQGSGSRSGPNLMDDGK